MNCTLYHSFGTHRIDLLQMEAQQRQMGGYAKTLNTMLQLMRNKTFPELKNENEFSIN